MKIFNLITVFIIAGLMLITCNINRAEAQWFHTQHWLSSTVHDSIDSTPVPADGKVGIAFNNNDSANPLNPSAAVITNTLMVNAVSLPGGWTVGNPVRMQIPQTSGGYGAGPVPPLSANAFVTTTAGFDYVGEMTIESVVPVIGGPQLYIKAFLQGYYSPSATAPTSRPAVIAVEAYNNGASPGHPGSLVAQTLIALDSTGTGHNGLSSDGTATGTLITPGDYILIIRHKLPGYAAGPNHMPVITSVTVTIPTAVITVPFDITTNPIDTLIWRASSTDNRYKYPMFPETDGAYSLKAGFSQGYDAATGQGSIGLSDQQIMANPTTWTKTIAIGADARADLDGDGTVGLADQQFMANPKNWLTFTSAPAHP